MPTQRESSRHNGKIKATKEVEAEEEVEVEVVAVVKTMANRVEDIMKRNDVLSIEENIYGENAQRIGEAMLIKRLMDVAEDKAEVETDVVINHTTHNSNSMSIYLLLLLKDKELYHLLQWLQ